MKLSFIHCVDQKISREQMYGVNYMPVWAYTLASYLRELNNLEIYLFDNRVDSENKIIDSNFFLFTGINQDYDSIIALSKKLKNKFPESKLLIGGPICWSFSTANKIEKLDNFDHILIGDGENLIKSIIEKLIHNIDIPKIIKNDKKFSLSNSIAMDQALIDQSLNKYYGGIIEVSRGCPFLCEFCDIRILPDNNRAHNKNESLIIEELSFFSSRGITQVLFACDNFIGDPVWAENVCDAIIQWQKESNQNIKLYTWLTINVSNHPRLLKKLKLAGFDMFFIGIESFGTNQLLETAKIQNVKVTLEESIKTIQSYGIIVVAGLIFGFDSDPDDVVNTTLAGIKESGIISGDPSLLTALPGTPLYKRMKYSNRLRDGKLGLGGFKYRTNIKYLKKEHEIINDFKFFVKSFNQGEFQFERLNNFYKNLIQQKNYISSGKGSYIKISKLLTSVLKNATTSFSLIERLGKLFFSFDRIKYIFKAFLLTKQMSSQQISLWRYFSFWLFIWSNSILKYSTLKDSDFDIGHVDEDFNFDNLIPEKYLDIKDEPIPLTKINSQRNLTVKALSNLKLKLER